MGFPSRREELNEEERATIVGARIKFAPGGSTE